MREGPCPACALGGFQRQLRSQVEIKKTTSGRRVATDGRPAEEAPRRPAPRRVLPSNNSGGWGGQEAERIRRAERALLDIWSNEDFLRSGAVLSIVLLFVFALVVGPPPSDGRCSLFWC
ncbi:hypothetical protein TSOC_011752 [Tetrabaena socialis]|uniref:Uncharacterized protein n=1 Tax=Tetrabaena socialis TaxID=47790 RepID=A0A2J7ZPS7_9CHLO|nr:hypothetical protein TSOC_011752 [Tetrabaena socialis]|eukprot:PNH02274.1 hypothetical protein TSOC_011752 [Tetrabaena socialis]